MLPSGESVMVPTINRSGSYPYYRAEDFAAVLKALDMRDPFEADQADFSRISDQERLFIGAVKHKVRVGVDEEGTEAAAATAIVGDSSVASLPEATMAIDRHFLSI